MKLSWQLVSTETEKFCKCYAKVNIYNNDRKSNMVRKYTLYFSLNVCWMTVALLE